MEGPLPNEYSNEKTKILGNGQSQPHDLNAAAAAEDFHSHVPTHYSRQTARSVSIFAAAIAIALLAVFLIVRHLRSTASGELQAETIRETDRAVPVDVVRVQRAQAGGVLNLPGDARSFYETTIFGRTNGYVSKWLVDIGDSVKENQVLAIIETPELDDQLHESNASLAQTKAQANVAATNAQFAKVSFDRWEAAAPEGAVSQQERDEKKAELDSALAKLEAAKAAVHLGEAQVQRLETLEKFKEVIAPFDGVITQRFLDIGSLVTAGSTTNTTPLYRISQSTTMRVFVDVPQPVVQDIVDGMHATVVARERPGETFSGVVDRNTSEIDPKSRTLQVEVLVPNPKRRLLPGMYVQVTFQTNRTDAPLRVPAAALTFGPDGPQVAVVADDHRLTFRPVTIGKDLGDVVEISSGVSENEMVALNVGSQVATGEEVDAHLIDLAPPKPPRSIVPKDSAHSTAAASAAEH